MAKVVSAFRRTGIVVSAFRRTGILVTFGIVACVVLAGVIVRGQQRGAAQAPSLTPQDYIDIQQLVSSYAYGLDGNTDNGATYANLFAPGGVFDGRAPKGVRTSRRWPTHSHAGRTTCVTSSPTT